MLTMLPPARPARQALLFAPALFIAISSIARSTGEWNDFRGYIIAGEALRQGLYSDHVSNTWPPFFSLFAAALIELQRLPAPAARVLWGSFNAVIFGIACARWFVASRSMEAPLWVAPAADFAIAPFVALHLVTHQVYALVFAMAIELFIAAQRGDDAAAGVWLGVSASLKITPLLTLPYFLLQRSWKLAATACATAALCSLAVAPALGMRGDIAAPLRCVSRAASPRGTHRVPSH